MASTVGMLISRIDDAFGDWPLYIFDMETTTDWVHGPAAHINGTKMVQMWMEPVGHSATGGLISAFKNPVVMVVHNGSFDMQHVFKHQKDKSAQGVASETLKSLALGDIILWDTQDMEYIITGHETKFAALDDLAEKYGTSRKTDVLKDYFAKGINTDAIPFTELRGYLEQDIKTTYEVAVAQAEELASVVIDQIRLACMRRATTTLMMHNGMPFDAVAASQQLIAMQEELTVIKDRWKQLADDWHETDSVRDWACDALTSPKKLHTYLFGGTVTYSYRQEVGKYKNGKPKYKKADIDETVNGWVDWAFDFDDANHSTYGTDEPSLSVLRGELLGLATTRKTQAIEAIDLVLKYREISKITSTYLAPLIEMAGVSVDGRIHPNLNTCATATGRLSSSKPNAQNMPTHSPVKSYFREDGWTCIEGDYKQLEMIALAIKTEDEQLLADLAAGVDIHYEVGKEVMGWKDPSDMTKDSRRIVKSVDFGLVYGGKAKTLSEQSGAPVATVQRVIDAFFKRYPKVKAYHERMELISKDVTLGEPVGTHEDGTTKRKLTIHDRITGRKYTFNTYPPFASATKNAYTKTRPATFSPTELKNYFVQGFATADFVPFACGLLAKAMAADGWMDEQPDGQPKAKLCGTVHDSILVWVRDEYAKEFAAFMKAAMEYAWPAMFEFFCAHPGERLNTEVVAEISMGPSWGETKEIKFDE